MNAECRPRSVTDYPTRRSGLANPRRGNQRPRHSDPRPSTLELPAQDTVPGPHNIGSAPNEALALAHSNGGRARLSGC
jgi:hypothetical protein